MAVKIGEVTIKKDSKGYLATTAIPTTDNKFGIKFVAYKHEPSEDQAIKSLEEYIKSKYNLVLEVKEITRL